MRLNSALLNKMWSKCSGDTDYASKIFRFLFQKDDLIGKNLFGRVFKLHLQPKDDVDGAVVETSVVKIIRIIRIFECFYRIGIRMQRPNIRIKKFENSMIRILFEKNSNIRMFLLFK
jgi:hypothetical protein